MNESLTTLPTWHPGETLIQERVGVRQRMAEVGPRVIRSFMPDQHRAFYQQLPFLVLGSVDAAGLAWATIQEGPPGFVAAPTPTRLEITATLPVDDPAGPGLVDGAAVGLLGIELHSRRRNRVNGVIGMAPQGFHLAVDQSFGNCPRYIQPRDLHLPAEPDTLPVPPAEHLASLDDDARRLIEGADTFFVASYAEQEGQRRVDVSHRGGKPGFVRVDGDGLLTIPDFNGNLFFNTLGNIIVNGQAGLLFVDYQSGELLQLSGTAEVLFDSPEIAAFAGAERLWSFRPQRLVRRRAALALRWTANPDGEADSVQLTGSWPQARARLQALERGNRWQSLRVARIVEESASIRSFYLAAADGADLVPAQAGQFLPLRLSPDEGQPPLLRSYSLSNAPADGHYRISVKREGRVSGWLHDQLHEGDLLDARLPAGDFTLAASGSHSLVLLAGGIGITPLLAMLRHLVHEGRRTQRFRPVILFYGARRKVERAFDAELAELVAATGGAIQVVRALSDTQDAVAGIDYEVAGRIDMQVLARFLPFGDHAFYLCGPAAFTQALYDGLRGYGIEDARIHAEAFGPAALQRSLPADAVAPARPPIATETVPVIFTESLKEARWTPAAGSLLELAEARGLAPAFSCRAGHCGSCRTRVLSGAVTYPREPAAAVAEGEALLCCAVPAAGSTRLELDL
ncbi:2Fe-2S iron-sulfur cluster-binding protein [Pseudomonas oryzihabitans]|uniref:2Fe-2S iron-sulfur cluster-binding protein n=1 Tax=Pseudomonas oryzihabitans TaxID=47885 RepID=UPI0028581EC8|nr:pyridoxamine 5'-phosphate oxidase family protein [Pseudomonas psychrotolerans]MDR6676569.1 ferredoxin-NADP reductase/predicted pyridoxine 5'-phosphate oxidase superfamily flavin-nucleotide-binding protein [Pseudomonas psychrotolerans]